MSFKGKATVQERLDKLLAEKPPEPPSVDEIKAPTLEERIAHVEGENRILRSDLEAANRRLDNQVGLHVQWQNLAMETLKDITKKVDATLVVSKQWFWLMVLHGGEARVSIEAAEIIARSKRARRKKRSVTVMRQTRRKG